MNVFSKCATIVEVQIPIENSVKKFPFLVRCFKITSSEQLIQYLSSFNRIKKVIIRLKRLVELFIAGYMTLTCIICAAKFIFCSLLAFNSELKSFPQKIHARFRFKAHFSSESHFTYTNFNLVFHDTYFC